MTVKTFTVSPFQSNCYVCHDGGDAVLVDAGSTTDLERGRILDYIEENGLVVKHLLLTHGHIDHIFDCAFFAGKYGKQWQMHEADVPLLEQASTQAQLFGVRIESPPPPARTLREGDMISFGSAQWDVLHCPGHSPGSICFYDRKNACIIVGDVLFRGSIGRTDLWEGSIDQLLGSIRSKLLPLPEETIVHCGHGLPTTIGEEKRNNPFLGLS